MVFLKLTLHCRDFICLSLAVYAQDFFSVREVDDLLLQVSCVVLVLADLLRGPVRKFKFQVADGATTVINNQRIDVVAFIYMHVGALAILFAQHAAVESFVMVRRTRVRVEGVEELIVGRVFPCIVLQSNSNSMDVLEGVADEEI